MIRWLWQHILVIHLCENRCTSPLEQFILIKLKFVEAFSLVLQLVLVPCSFDLWVWFHCMQNKQIICMKPPQNWKLYCLACLGYELYNSECYHWLLRIIFSILQRCYNKLKKNKFYIFLKHFWVYSNMLYYSSMYFLFKKVILSKFSFSADVKRN